MSTVGKWTGNENLYAGINNICTFRAHQRRKCGLKYILCHHSHWATLYWIRSGTRNHAVMGTHRHDQWG